jgi:hypothetical protein
MPDDTDDLMGKVYALFTGIYGAGGGLAFEKLGVALTAGMFKLNDSDAGPNAAVATDRLSLDIASYIPQIDGGSVSWSLETYSNQAMLLATAATPLTPGDMASVGNAMNSVSAAFHQPWPGSLDGRERLPVYASPPDWYNAAANDNWAMHTVNQQSTPSSTQPPPPSVPKPPVVLAPPVWRVLPTAYRPALMQPAAMAASPASHPALAAAATPQVAPAARLMMVHPMIRMAPPATNPGPAPVTPVPALATNLAMTSMQMQLHTVATTAQPVTTNGIQISFDHCIVSISRPWWPELLFTLRNWFLPGFPKGSYANGTGAGDPGLMPVLTRGFIVIRNLKISANWSQADNEAAQGSASFGPFSLIGRSFDSASGTLTCPGMQIIGWFYSALPVLPPASDPALSATTNPLQTSPTPPPQTAPTPSTAPSGDTPQSVATSSPPPVDGTAASPTPATTATAQT